MKQTRERERESVLRAVGKSKYVWVASLPPWRFSQEWERESSIAFSHERAFRYIPPRLLPFFSLFILSIPPSYPPKPSETFPSLEYLFSFSRPFFSYVVIRKEERGLPMVKNAIVYKTGKRGSWGGRGLLKKLKLNSSLYSIFSMSNNFSRSFTTQITSRCYFICRISFLFLPPIYKRDIPKPQ